MLCKPLLFILLLLLLLLLPFIVKLLLLRQAIWGMRVAVCSASLTRS
jgi:hypothetical protein